MYDKAPFRFWNAIYCACVRENKAFQLSTAQGTVVPVLPVPNKQIKLNTNMKKTLITLLVLGGLASAESALTTTVFKDLNTSTTLNNITWNATAGTITAANGGILCSTASSKQARATISFTLNLTAAAAVTGKTDFITVDSSTDYGLWLTADGISGRWDTGEYNTRGDKNTVAEYSGVVSIDSILSSNNNVYTVDENKFIALTLVLDRAADNNAGNGDNVGATLYDASGSRVWYCEALGSGSNTSYDGYTLNTNFITSASITPDIVTSEKAGKLAAALVPEPATATLSLLALVSLFARRRRH